ncbi:hypothetical protein L1887_09239 [Cichorium endivia]|nr:hypothetical protein L1887_09239 [Cichorium endivia]
MFFFLAFLLNPRFVSLNIFVTHSCQNFTLKMYIHFFATVELSIPPWPSCCESVPIKVNISPTDENIAKLP